MSRKQDRPAWWQLWLLGLGVLGLLAWEALAPMSERGHGLAAVATVLLAWTLVEGWLRAHRRAMLHVDGLTLVEPAGPQGTVPDGWEGMPSAPAGSAGAEAPAPPPTRFAGGGTGRSEGVAP